MWAMRKVEVILVVVAALGAIPKGLTDYYEESLRFDRWPGPM